MRLCLRCSATFTETVWKCPNCGFAPERVDGFVCHAPALAQECQGYDIEAHHLLSEGQENHFWFRSRNRLIADLVRKWAPEVSDVLEIGCGTGFVLAGLREVLPRSHLVGSEIHTRALHYAAERVGRDVLLMQLDARSLPFTEEFGLIAACDVIEHLNEDEAVLAEIHRALKPGGFALITVPQHPWLWSRADEFAHHRRRYRRGELAAKCRKAGLIPVVDTSFVTFLLPLMLLQRALLARRTDYHFKEELAISPHLNGLLFAVLEIERLSLKAGLRFPVGGSRVVMARKA